MDYYIQGDAANADKIKAAFKKLDVASNADKFSYTNGNMLYFTAAGMIHMIYVNGSWANPQMDCISCPKRSTGGTWSTSTNLNKED